MKTKIRRIILYVADMQRQVEFYRDILGLPVEGEAKDDYTGDYWVTFATGDCQLSLHGGGTGQFGEDAPKFCFYADDAVSIRETLEAAGVSVSELRKPEPGVIVFDADDPEGNRFAIESSR